MTILKNADLWKLLYISDVVIVTNSTVGYEAIVMEKPLIQDRLSKSERDYLDYTKDGAAIPIYDTGHIRVRTMIKEGFVPNLIGVLVVGLMCYLMLVVLAP